MNRIYLILFLLSIQIGLSQTIPIEDEINVSPFERQQMYFKDENNVLQKFLGHWHYNGTQSGVEKSLDLYIEFVSNRNVGGYFKDGLKASYVYKENGTEIYNTLMLAQKPIYGGLFRDTNNLNKLWLMYGEPTDGSKQMRYEFTIEVIDGAIPQLKWDVETIFQFIEEGEEPRIPNHVVLIKV